MWSRPLWQRDDLLLKGTTFQAACNLDLDHWPKNAQISWAMLWGSFLPAELRSEITIPWPNFVYRSIFTNLLCILHLAKIWTNWWEKKKDTNKHQLFPLPLGISHLPSCQKNPRHISPHQQSKALLSPASKLHWNQAPLITTPLDTLAWDPSGKLLRRPKKAQQEGTEINRGWWNCWKNQKQKSLIFGI